MRVNGHFEVPSDSVWVQFIALRPVVGGIRGRSQPPTCDIVVVESIGRRGVLLPRQFLEAVGEMFVQL